MLGPYTTGPGSRMVDIIAASLNSIVDKLSVAAVFCRTESGATARNVTRFRMPCWILAVSNSEKTCQELMFSYGVWPIYRRDKPVKWGDDIKDLVRDLELEGESVLLIEGPSMAHPDAEHRLEIVRLTR